MIPYLQRGSTRHAPEPLVNIQQAQKRIYMLRLKLIVSELLTRECTVTGLLCNDWHDQNPRANGSSFRLAGIGGEFI